MELANILINGFGAFVRDMIHMVSYEKEPPIYRLRWSFMIGKNNETNKIIPQCG